MRRRDRARMSVAAGTAALLLATGFATQAPPAAAAKAVRVMDFNFCGAICNKGVVSKPGNNNDVVEDIRNRIVAFRPDVVMLNEACQGQVARLKDLLAGSSWRMGGVFRDQRNDNRCDGGKGFGDAVLTAGPVGNTEVLPLPNHGPEHRAVLCLRTSAGGPVLACTLHLVTGKKGSKEKQLQIAAAARALNKRAHGGAVIVGGDFNLSPGQMGSLLNPAKGGRFFDIDPAKRPTRGQKIDYVLFSRGHFSNPSGGPQHSRFSDHKVLLGSATRH